MIGVKSLTLGLAMVLSSMVFPGVATVLLTGEIEVMGSEAFYAPRVSGWQTQIEWLRPEGEVTKPGDLIVMFDRSSIDTDIELKQASLAKARDQLALSHLEAKSKIETATFEHNKALLELQKVHLDASVPQQFVSLYDFEKAAVNLQIKKQAVQKAARNIQAVKSEVANDLSKKQIEIDKIEFDLAALLGQSDLTALKTNTGGPVIYVEHPWDGTKISSGASVRATWRVAEVAGGDKMRVVAWLNEVDKSAVKQGQGVEIVFDASQGEAYAGQITEIVPQAENRSAWGKAAYYKIEVNFEQLPNIPLIPGMSVMVRVL